MKRPPILLKAHVEGHTRRTRGGKVVTVHPYETHVRAIGQAARRFDTAGAAGSRGRLRSFRSGYERAEVRHADGRQSDAADAMRDAVHAMAEMPDLPAHAKALVDAGHEAFGRQGERPGSIDPEAFIDAFRQFQEADRAHRTGKA